MAKVSSEDDGDPDQLAARSMFSPERDEGDAMPEAKDVVIGDDDRDNARRGNRSVDPGEVDAPRSRERAPPNPPRETPRGRPDDGVEELRRQHDREKAMRERAEQAAAQAIARATRAEQQYGVAASGMIESAIEAASRQSAQAEAKYIAALDISDHAGAAKAQTEMADARFNLLRLQEQRQAFADEAARVKAQPQRQQPQQGDNLSRITGELDRTGYRKSAEWLRAHGDLVADQAGINRVDGAHGYIVNVLKVPIESDRYFDEMERVLLDGESVEPEPRRAAPQRRDMRQPQRAAPVSRSQTSLRDGRQRRTVHLTPEQRDHAHNVLGMTDEEYAASLADAEDRGMLLGVRR
jgi:hypothetical protein